MQRLVAADEITDFVQRCMEAVVAAGPHAASLAHVLLTADTRGHYSHGLNKLGTQRRASLASQPYFSLFHRKYREIRLARETRGGRCVPPMIHVLCIVLSKLESECLTPEGSILIWYTHTRRRWT